MAQATVEVAALVSFPSRRLGCIDTRLKRSKKTESDQALASEKERESVCVCVKERGGRRGPEEGAAKPHLMKPVGWLLTV